MHRKPITLILLSLYLIVETLQICMHSHFARKQNLHFYNDLHEQTARRLLQTYPTFGKMRIFVDYTWLQGSQFQINHIKRIMNITANYYYNILTLPRLNILKYPIDAPPNCNIIQVPSQYVSNGTIGDFGAFVSSQANPLQFVAKSSACLLQKSDNRPIWGVVIWNLNYLELDQVGFQKNVYVGIHEMLHMLGYSSALYQLYPTGNPFRNQSGLLYLTSPQIVRQMNAHFNCTNSKGLILEDQDGTFIPSHSQYKVFGPEVMAANTKKGSYFSRVTAALLETTGWYNVSYNFTEPTVWGSNKGCGFLNIDNCTSDQFCTGTNFSCDAQATAIGRCQVDSLSGSCKAINYFVNTICTDQNYQLKNLNANLSASQRGGDTSRCHSSNFRKTGLQPSILNFRCYVTICSASRSFLYVLVDQYILVCIGARPGMVLNAPQGYQGTLRCPQKFDSYCGSKRTCPFHCNRNGACINGRCLCTGNQNLTATCLDTGLSIAQIGNTGGLLNSLRLNEILDSPGVLKSKEANQALQKITKSIRQSGDFQISKQAKIKTAVPQGFYIDQFGQYIPCQATFKCDTCTKYGCIQKCPINAKEAKGCLKIK